VALNFKVTSQSITQRAFGLPKDTLDPFMAEAGVMPYDIPNTQYDLVIHDTGLRVGYWRSVSHALNAFANESFVDEMALAAGKDPYAYRMSLLDKQPRFANVLKMAADKSGWGTPAPAGRSRGIALMEGYDTYMAQVAEVSVKDNQVTVHRMTVVADLGRMVNPDTVQAQIQSSVVFGLSAGAEQPDHAGQGPGAADQFRRLPGAAHARVAGDGHHAGAQHRKARRHRRAGHGAGGAGGGQCGVRGHRQAGAHAAAERQPRQSLMHRGLAPGSRQE
jgi:hypothetical protein